VGLNIFINIIWNFVVYCSKISDVNKLKTRLTDECAQFDQSIVDATIIQWRRHVLVSMYVGHTSSINSDNFETNCYTNLNSAK